MTGFHPIRIPNPGGRVKVRPDADIGVRADPDLGRRGLKRGCGSEEKGSKKAAAWFMRRLREGWESLAAATEEHEQAKTTEERRGWLGDCCQSSS